MSPSAGQRSSASDARRFRARLSVAMMVIVSVITAAIVALNERNAGSNLEKQLEAEFRSQLGALLGEQGARQAAVRESCRRLAKSVRIRAALAEDSVEDLYRNAEVELRDLLSGEPSADAKAPHAEFFRFLDATGAVLPPGGEASSAPAEPWEKQIGTAGLTGEGQQTGYLALQRGPGGPVLREIIATPVLASATEEKRGMLVLGFAPSELRARPGRGEIRSGLWVGGHLEIPALPASARESLRAALAARLDGAPAAGSNNFRVTLDGAPHLIFHQLLNPNSRLAPAWRVCLYPLAAALAEQRRQRWQVVGLGLGVLLAGLAGIWMLSARLARPVEQLAADSEEHRARSVQADQDLAVANRQLEKALAELKATQEHIIQQERLRALGQMASGIAHDFNNALMPITGFSELLLMRPEILTDPKKAAHYLGIINTGAQDAAKIVGRLREFYRSTDQHDVLAAVDARRLAEQAVALTQPKWKDQAQSGGAEVIVRTELDDFAPVAGDEAALREVLTNLIFNAVDAMPAGGTLTLRTRAEAEHGVIEITDTGTGMTPEVRARCLEPFFSTKGERGTGLGLAMVFGIVQRHRGSIDIDSAVGRGTTFIIRLPYYAAGEAAAQTDEPATASRPLHILLVDDEPEIRDVLSEFLTIDGHTVETARHGVEGLARFRESRFDLVVTDKAMPGMSGDQMAVSIKESAPDMPVVLLTGFSPFLGEEAIPGIDVLATKPITMPALREAIDKAMKAA